MSVKTKIACLPVAGDQNPYQKLMMEGLNENNDLCAFNGIDDRFLGIIRTAIKYKPSFIHLDWIVSYYYRRNIILTLLSVPLFCLQIWLVRFLFGIKIVWTFHNVLPHDLPFKNIHLFCQKFLIWHCEWIRVFSLETKLTILNQYKIKEHLVKIVPEGSFVTDYPNTITKRQALSNLNLPESGKILLYFGLIKPYKGIIELIDAFKHIAVDNSFLIISGKIMDHEYGQKIISLKNDRILVFDEFVSTDKVQTFFNAADIVVSPFLKVENSGTVILSMGFSKAIIAPKMGAIAERLKNQPDLLYSDQSALKNTLMYALRKRTEELQTIGDLNYQSLQENKWSDFQACFTKQIRNT